MKTDKFNYTAKEETTYTRYSGPTNSTEFSACCGLAVLKSENKCPGCGAFVIKRASNK